MHVRFFTRFHDSWWNRVVRSSHCCCGPESSAVPKCAAPDGTGADYQLVKGLQTEKQTDGEKALECIVLSLILFFLGGGAWSALCTNLAWLNLLNFSPESALLVQPHLYIHLHTFFFCVCVFTRQQIHLYAYQELGFATFNYNYIIMG